MMISCFVAPQLFLFRKNTLSALQNRICKVLKENLNGKLMYVINRIIEICLLYVWNHFKKQKSF